MTEHLRKATLMVIKSLLALIVYSPDIDHYVAGIEDSWIPTAFYILIITSKG
jgi:hypothetical protein